MDNFISVFGKKFNYKIDVLEDPYTNNTTVYIKIHGIKDEVRYSVDPFFLKQSHISLETLIKEKLLVDVENYIRNSLISNEPITKQDFLRSFLETSFLHKQQLSSDSEYNLFRPRRHGSTSALLSFLNDYDFKNVKVVVKSPHALRMLINEINYPHNRIILFDHFHHYSRGIKDTCFIFHDIYFTEYVHNNFYFCSGTPSD